VHHGNLTTQKINLIKGLKKNQKTISYERTNFFVYCASTIFAQVSSKTLKYVHMVMLRMKRKKGGEPNVLNPKTLNPKP
jgi:hypothetical protein